MRADDESVEGFPGLVRGKGDFGRRIDEMVERLYAREDSAKELIKDSGLLAIVARLFPSL